MKNTHRPRGFTLIEQMFTLAVAAVLVTIAIPSMAGLITRSATRVTEDTLFTAARLARTQAIMHNTHVLLCPSAGGLHCDATSDWQQGWIVAMDRNRDDQPDGAALARGKPDATHVRVRGSQGRPRVRFRADGSAAGTNLTFIICPRNEDDGQARSVVISNTGRIREAPADPAHAAECGTPD